VVVVAEEDETEERIRVRGRARDEVRSWGRSGRGHGL